MFISAMVFVACKPEKFEAFGDMVGIVVDKETDDSIAGVTVTILPTSKNTYTGSDGQFEFKDLDVQQYTVTAQKTGYQSNRKIVNVVAGETVTVSIELQKIN